MDTEKYNRVKARLEQHLLEALANLPMIEEVADFYLRELDKNIQNYLEDLRPFEEDYARLTADVRDILDTLAFEITKRAISKEYNG